MKMVNRVVALALATVFTVSPAAVVFAQTQDAANQKTRQRMATKDSEQVKGSSNDPSPKPQQTAAPRERPDREGNSRTPSDVPPEMQANRQEQISEAEGAVEP